MINTISSLSKVKKKWSLPFQALTRIFLVSGKRFFKHGQLDNRSGNANILNPHVCRTITVDIFRIQYRIKCHTVKHPRWVEILFPFVPVVSHEGRFRRSKNARAYGERLIILSWLVAFRLGSLELRDTGTPDFSRLRTQGLSCSS